MIERATRGRVIAIVHGNQQHPDIMCEVFILVPTDLVDDQETGNAGPSGAVDRRIRVRPLDARSTLGIGGHHCEVDPQTVGSTT